MWSANQVWRDENTYCFFKEYILMLLLDASIKIRKIFLETNLQIWFRVPFGCNKNFRTELSKQNCDIWCHNKNLLSPIAEFILQPIRKVHLHRSAIPSGTTNGILSDPDVHSQSADCYPIMGFILDQHGCCSSQGGFGNNHCADYDHTEFRVTGFPTKGKCTEWTHAYICTNIYIYVIYIISLSVFIRSL